MIYLDVLLAVNLFIDFVLLESTARLLRLPHKRWRVVAGAAAGAASCCIILVPLSAVWLAIFKLAAAAVLIRTAFAWRGVLPYIKQLVVFFVLSTVFAGVAMALFVFAAPVGLYVIGGVVYYDVSPLMLTALTVLSYGIIRLWDRFTRKREPVGRDYRLRATLAGRTVELRALYDSGNGLTEPFSGAPVAVAAYKSVEPLLSLSLRETMRGLLEGAPDTGAAMQAGLRLVPYQSVGGTGLLPAFRPDALGILPENGPERAVTGAYVAVCDTLGRGDYEVLVGIDLMDGIDEHEETTAKGREHVWQRH